MKKYELTNEIIEFRGRKLYRIRAMVDFGDVKAGDLGGYIESEENLSQEGLCWVCGTAWVCGNAKVYGNARVYGTAWVYGNARVCGNAKVYGNARVYGTAWVYGNARVYGNAWVYGNARVYGTAWVCGNARVSGDARIYGDKDFACISGFGRVQRTTTFFRTVDGTIGVVCGCFTGSLDEFRAKVRETHGDSKYAREYLMIADLMEMHFGEETQ